MLSLIIFHVFLHRWGLLCNPTRPVHLPRSPRILWETECHTGLHWTTVCCLDAGPGQLPSWLAGRWQPPIPHREPSACLWGRETWRENYLLVSQSDRLPRPTVKTSCLLFQRYYPAPHYSRGGGFLSADCMQPKRHFYPLFISFSSTIILWGFRGGTDCNSGGPRGRGSPFWGGNYCGNGVCHWLWKSNWVGSGSLSN